MIRTYQYLMTVEVDDQKIPTIYPNFRFTYGTARDFAASFATNEDHLVEYGYRVKFESLTPVTK